MRKEVNVMALCGLLFTCIGGPFFIMGLVMFVNLDILVEDGGPEMFMLPLIFTCLGFIITAIGVVVTYFWLQQRKAKKELIAHGTKVMANILDIVEDWSVRFNGHPGLCVVCEYISPNGKAFTCTSDPTFGDLHSFTPGRGVQVYVDNVYDVTKYVVDLTNSYER